MRSAGPHQTGARAKDRFAPRGSLVQTCSQLPSHPLQSQKVQASSLLHILNKTAYTRLPPTLQHQYSPARTTPGLQDPIFSFCSGFNTLPHSRAPWQSQHFSSRHPEGKVTLQCPTGDPELLRCMRAWGCSGCKSQKRPHPHPPEGTICSNSDLLQVLHLWAEGGMGSKAHLCRLKGC